MKNKLKKVNKKVETLEEIIKKEEMEARKNLLKFIKKNPGSTLNELSDNFTGLDAYEFLNAMVTLFEEYKLVEDSGCYFTDEVTRQKMRQ
jgi:hypothetical protein